MNRVLAVIPARGGSKGVPGKNTRPLAGIPLIAHTIRAAAESRLTRTIVSTDDDDIARVAREYGADVPFLRPPELATDSAKSIDVMRHALHEIDEDYDALMMLQPTTPMRQSSHIDESLALLEGSGADSVISVVDVEGHHPARMKYIRDGRLVDPVFCEAVENQPRQELEPMYIRNGAIYLSRTFVIRAGGFKGRDCRPLVMSAECSINIDTELDFALVEFMHGRAV